MQISILLVVASAMGAYALPSPQNRDPPAWNKFDARAAEIDQRAPQNRDPPAWDKFDAREAAPQNRDPPAWDKFDAREATPQNRDPPAWGPLNVREESEVSAQGCRLFTCTCKYSILYFFPRCLDCWELFADMENRRKSTAIAKRDDGTWDTKE